MKRTLSALIALGLVLTACSGGDAAETTLEATGDALYGGGTSGPVDETETVDGADLLASSQLNLDVAVSENRKVIRNASLRLASDDTRATFDEIVRIAEAAGGFIESAEVSPTDEGLEPFINLTVRIPAIALTKALGEFKDAADAVVSESQGAQDVTETYIDLEAQLTNLKALEVELRALLAEVRKQPDADPDKLLRVFSEIANTRGQIEQIQGQLNFLSDAVDLATAQISIEPTPQAVPIVEEGWAPSETVRSATRTLVSGMQDLVDVGITFAIAVLPMLILVLLIPGLVVLTAYRYWRRRRHNRPTPSSGEPIPTE